MLVYYSSSGIMESLPTEDPGEGNQPIGALAMVTAAVVELGKVQWCWVIGMMCVCES